MIGHTFILRPPLVDDKARYHRFVQHPEQTLPKSRPKLGASPERRLHGTFTLDNARVLSIVDGMRQGALKFDTMSLVSVGSY